MTSDRSTSSSLSQNTKSIEENSNKTSSVASSSNSASLMSENESSVRNTSSSRTNHHPYATSLVNSGFGFGFDLQGGEIDNQLTFIINVQPNGDAARKGLADGLCFIFIISFLIIILNRYIRDNVSSFSFFNTLSYFLILYNLSCKKINNFISFFSFFLSTTKSSIFKRVSYLLS